MASCPSLVHFVLTYFEMRTLRMQKKRVGGITIFRPKIIMPLNETEQEVRDRVLEAASFIPANQLGTTDDCGFAPFADDTSTARDTAFQKIRARVEGTELAARQLGH